MMSYNNRYKVYPDSSSVLFAGDDPKVDFYGATFYGIPVMIMFANGDIIDFGKTDPSLLKPFLSGVVIEGDIVAIELLDGFCIGNNK